MVNARAILGARSDVYKQKYNMVALIVKKKLLYKKITCGATNRQYQQSKKHNNSTTHQSVMKVSLSPRAYSKVLLHGCKYPHKAINGVFLAEDCKHTGDLLRIVDAIPLFHQCLGLAPMLEIALHQVLLILLISNFINLAFIL